MLFYLIVPLFTQKRLRVMLFYLIVPLFTQKRLRVMLFYLIVPVSSVQHERAQTVPGERGQHLRDQPQTHGRHTAGDGTFYDQSFI